jgi:hypothetical protein
MKKLPLSKPTKFNKTKAKNKLDKLFSLSVRSIGICQLAGKDKVHCGGPLQCMHVIGRGNLYLRWDKRNALSGCAGHHVYYTYHPEAWRDLMVKEMPLNYEQLLDEREKKISFNEGYYLEKLKSLEREGLPIDSFV